METVLKLRTTVTASLRKKQLPHFSSSSRLGVRHLTTPMHCRLA